MVVASGCGEQEAGVGKVYHNGCQESGTKSVSGANNFFLTFTHKNRSYTK